MRNVLLLCFFITSLPLYAQQEQILVKKIKVIGNSYTSRELLLSYFREVRQGGFVNKANLDTILQRVQERIFLTKWFYSVSIYSNPAKETNAINVILEVEEGFLLRFWGGPIFGGFGMANISGMGKYLGCELGLNRQTILYRDDYFFSPDIFIDVVVGNTEQKYLSETNVVTMHSVGGLLWSGISLPYDMRIGILLDAGALFSEKYTYADQYYYAAIRLKADVRSDLFSSKRGYTFDIKAGYMYPQGIFRETVEANVYISVIDWLTLAIRGSIGAQQNTSSSYEYLQLSFFGINGVRAPYTRNMYGDVVCYANTELRFHALDFRLFDFVSLNIDPALFFDIGNAFSIANNSLVAKPLEMAFGIAPRIYLGMPVFVPIRFEIGWNTALQMNLFFAVENIF